MMERMRSLKLTKGFVVKYTTLSVHKTFTYVFYHEYFCTLMEYNSRMHIANTWSIMSMYGLMMAL
jgi:hypothetical protein